MHFFALDVETANADRSSICSIGFVEFKDGVVVREWYGLVDPQQMFDSMNVSIHGITPSDVRGAPTFREVMPVLTEALTGQVVFSHMSFDRTAITAACQRAGIADLGCRWADSAKLARRAWAECRSSGYGLKDVCSLIGFSFNHHNALEDAMACGEIVNAVSKRTGFDLGGLLDLQTRPLSGKKAWTPAPESAAAEQRDHLADILMDRIVIGRPTKERAAQAPGQHPIVVFTGQMALTREEMEGMAARNGYEPQRRVTKETTHLVIGDEDWAAGVRSGKRKRAEDYLAKGQDIVVMPESDFRVLVLGMEREERFPDVWPAADLVEVWTFGPDGDVVITKEPARP